MEQEEFVQEHINFRGEHDNRIVGCSLCTLRLSLRIPGAALDIDNNKAMKCELQLHTVPTLILHRGNPLAR
jgi:hypothetical protein